MLIEKRGDCDYKGKCEKTGFISQDTDRFLKNSCYFAHCFTPLWCTRCANKCIHAAWIYLHLLRAVEGTGSALQTAHANEAIFFPCCTTPNELNSQTAALSPFHWSLSVIYLIQLVITETSLPIKIIPCLQLINSFSWKNCLKIFHPFSYSLSSPNNFFLPNFLMNIFISPISSDIAYPIFSHQNASLGV